MPDHSTSAIPARSPSWKWLVCGLLLLATMVNYMDRQTLSLTSLRIMNELDLDKRHFGQLESVFAFAFALGAIVFGWLADRWNVTWLYPLAVLAWSAAGFATGLVRGFTGLMACRFFLGFAEAGNWPCALRTTQHLLPSSQRSMGNSILQSGAAIGAIITPLIVGALVLGGDASVTGAWRYPFMVVGAAGATWVFLWLATVRRSDLAVEHRPSPSLVVIVVPLAALFTLDVALQAAKLDADSVRRLADVIGADPETLVEYVNAPWTTLGLKFGVGLVGIALVFRWLLLNTRDGGDGNSLPRRDFVRRFCVLIVLVVTINTTWHFFRAWLPLFLQEQHHFSERSMYRFNTAYYVSADLGSLAAGFTVLHLTRRGQSVHASRVWVFVACALGTALSVAVAVVQDEWVLMGLLLLFGFAALGLYPVYYSFGQELTTRHQGKLTGALGCINWLAMYVMQAAVGETVTVTKSYSVGVALAGLAPLLGAVALVFFWGRVVPQATDGKVVTTAAA
jgi:MFS transporter, ACS family, hexuronate transporter